MTIKVLGICGSPRNGGNSEFLLDLALEAAKECAPDEVEIRKVSFAGKTLKGCISCYKCVGNKGICVMRDQDDTQEIIDAFIDADAVIYSVPIYHMGLPGLVKAYIDRLGMFIMTSNDLKAPRYMKAISCIAQGDCIFSGQEMTIMQIMCHATVTGNIYVPGATPECYIGAGGWTMLELDTECIKRQYEQGRKEQEFTVNGAKSIGTRVVETVQIIQAGIAGKREELQDKPAYEFLLKRV